jgi:phosphohistidine phosphatase SixA
VKKIVIALLCAVFSTFTLASDLSDKLRSADHVLLMRHALAPGVGDPANYTLSDCKTQRNLSADGRQHAVVVGNWLRQQGVQSAEVFSSVWCRCQDTAELLKFDKFTVAPALASFFDEMHRSNERTRALEQLIATQLKTKGPKALILVTHHVNIHAFMGENIGSGDLVLTKVNSQGKMVSATVIPRPQ